MAIVENTVRNYEPLTEVLTTYFSDDTYKYRFLRKEKYKNQNCYVIQLKRKDEDVKEPDITGYTIINRK